MVKTTHKNQLKSFKEQILFNDGRSSLIYRALEMQAVPEGEPIAT